MKDKVYYIGYIRDLEVYIPCSISEEHIDCYNMLVLFVKKTGKDIADKIYMKQVSEEVVNKMSKGIGYYGFDSIKRDIINNNKNKNYKGNFRYIEFLRKTEDNNYVGVTINTEKKEG